MKDFPLGYGYFVSSKMDPKPNGRITRMRCNRYCTMYMDRVNKKNYESIREVCHLHYEIICICLSWLRINLLSVIIMELYKEVAGKYGWRKTEKILDLSSINFVKKWRAILLDKINKTELFDHILILLYTDFCSYGL